MGQPRNSGSDFLNQPVADRRILTCVPSHQQVHMQQIFGRIHDDGAKDNVFLRSHRQRCGYQGNAKPAGHQRDQGLQLPRLLNNFWQKSRSLAKTDKLIVKALPQSSGLCHESLILE